MKICKRANPKKWRVFEDFEYREICWSGDSLAYCPICSLCVDAPEYKETHDYVKLNEGIEHFEKY